MSPRILISALLASLRKQAKVKIAETRQLEDGTEVKILEGKLPLFPHGERPTWYPLVTLPGQDTIDMREAEAILRHFWNAQIQLSPVKAIKHSKAALKRKQ
jgi:hypothetical protein